MKYEGPIYGVGRNFNGRKIYFDTGRTSQEWDAMETKIVNLERENAMLLKDKERYEWLKDGKGSHWAYNYLRDNFRINDDALDAARAKEGGAS